MWIKYTYRSIDRSLPEEGGRTHRCSAQLISLSLSGQSNPTDRFDHSWMGRNTGFATSQCAVPAIYLIRRSIPAPQETEIGVPVRTDLSYLSLQDGAFSARYIYKSLMIELFKFSFAEVLTVQNSNTIIVVPPIVRNPTVIRRFRPRSESEAN